MGVCLLFLCTIRVRPDIAVHRTVYVGVALQSSKRDDMIVTAGVKIGKTLGSVVRKSNLVLRLIRNRFIAEDYKLFFFSAFRENCPETRPRKVIYIKD